MLYCSAETNKTPGTIDLRLQGAWTIAVLRDIEKDLTGIPIDNVTRVALDGGALEDFDTSTAWYLHTLVKMWQGGGMTVEMKRFKDGHRHIFDRIAALPQEKEEPSAPRRPMRDLVTGLGEHLDNVWRDAHRAVGFLGIFLTGVLHRLRWRSIVFHINEIGIKAVPIISLMAFSIAFVMGYQGAFQLQKFDATVYTVDLVVLSILREMGVLITAIMVAGRSGSAFAAQIGTMKLNEEVDALQTMGVSPYEALVIPRLVAILVALPLLTLLADFMGLLGGYVFSATYLGYPYTQFVARMQEAASMTQFYVGVSKAPVFALLIGIVGCMQGLQARGSAEDVGRKTITAVVQSIFLVIVADAIFSVIFTKMGI